MGLLDGLKKMKNYLTGGGVKIEIRDIEAPKLKTPFSVEVIITVEDEDIETDKICLRIRNEEHVKMSVNVMGNDGTQRSQEERKKNILYEHIYLMDENKQLRANQTYTYTVEISLPPECFPVFHGVNAKYTWSMQAYIDKSGNNPNTKVIYFEPAYTLS